MKNYLAIVCLTGLLTGCDTFFTVRATVVDHSTGEPLAGANGLLVLDKGIGEQDQAVATGDDGRLFLLMNEPDDVWATLTIAKHGYCTWATQFRGAPRHEIVVRLVPNGPRKNTAGKPAG